MRPNCPVCNSIQTKLTSSNSVLLPFSNYKCKNCGHNFVLKDQKKKGGCLWSIIKFTLSAIFLALILLWLFKDDVPKQSKETSNNINVSTKQAVASNEAQSIKNSQNMDDTLSISTKIRDN